MTDAKSTSVPDRSQQLVTRLRAHATSLRRQAYALLALILLILVGGTVLFAYAGTIGSTELFSLEDVAQQLKDVREQYKRMSFNLDDFNDLAHKLKQSLTESTADGHLATEPAYMATVTRMTEGGGLISQLQDSLEKNHAALDRLDIQLEHRDPTKMALPQVLLSSTIARISIVVILMFLVQILVVTYRYNVRLAAYYDSRADVLELLGVTPGLDQLVLAANFFAPERLDFGKAPKTLIENVMDVLRGQAEKLKPGSD